MNVKKFSSLSNDKKCEHFCKLIDEKLSIENYIDYIEKINHTEEFFPIFTAVKNNDLTSLKLLSTKYDTLNIRNKNNISLLEEANKVETEILEFILDAGADPNFTYMVKDIDWTCLHSSSEKDRIENVKMLIRKGANVNSLNKENTSPLRLACIYDRSEIAKILLNNGANIDVLSSDNECVVHGAIKNGNIGIIDVLINHVNNIEIWNKKFPLSIQLAVKYNKSKIFDLLMYHECFIGKCMTYDTPLDIAAINRNIYFIRRLVSVSPKTKLLSSFIEDTNDYEILTILYSLGYKIVNNNKYFLKHIFCFIVENIGIFRILGMEILMKILKEIFPSIRGKYFLILINIFSHRNGGRLVMGELTGSSKIKLLEINN